jgi:Family of unknown function (DUF6644)
MAHLLIGSSAHQHIMINTALQWLEDSSLAAAIRQSLWLYPGIEIVHITGIVILVGPALIFDLRLLGFAKKIPVPVLADYLLSWSRRGLFLVIPSGLLLFITNATTLAYDPVFWLKMTLLVVAGLNALFFHRFTLIKISSPGESYKVRAPGIGAAIVSIVSWIAIIACGRLLAY